MKKILSAILCLVLMSGCAGIPTTTTRFAADGITPISTTSTPTSLTGSTDYTEFKEMYIAYSDDKVSMAQACVPKMVPSDQVQAALLTANQSMCVAMVANMRFDQTEPTTWAKVLYHAVDSIVPVAGFTALYKLGSVGVQNAGSKFGNNATISDGFNKTSTDPLVLGNNNVLSPTLSGTVPQQVVSPTSIVPSGSFNVVPGGGSL